MKRALVPIADGSEEIEVVIIVDTLRRAGWKVIIAGVTGTAITASRGVKLVPDCLWDDVDPDIFDALVIPGGGPGTEHMIKDERLLSTVRTFNEKGKRIAAICAAPLVLQAAGILEERTVTAYPGTDLTVPTRVDERVVVDGNILTGKGPGTAFEFALKLIEIDDSPKRSAEVAAAMIVG
ncbi:MAG: DJ-1/PfpI family protein [Verrucomicrobia bacterium]|nr:DJ-1/PfpI family protein [Verrucomicrobiota bacterium]